MAKNKKYDFKEKNEMVDANEDEKTLNEQTEEIISVSDAEENKLAADEVLAETPIETQVDSEVQFKWDGIVRAGVFAKLIEANLSEAEEKKWVEKFAEAGLAFQHIIEPVEVDKEVATDEPRDPEDTWLQYKQYKARKLNK